MNLRQLCISSLPELVFDHLITKQPSLINAMTTMEQSLQDLIFSHEELLWPCTDDDTEIPLFFRHRDVNHIVDTPNPKAPPGTDPRLENLALLFSLCYRYVRDEALYENLVPGSDKFWARVALDFHAETHEDDSSPPKHMKKTWPLCVKLLAGRRRWLMMHKGSIQAGERSTVPGTKWEVMMHLFGLACKRRYALGLTMLWNRDLRYEYEQPVYAIDEEIKKCTEKLEILN